MLHRTLIVVSILLVLLGGPALATPPVGLGEISCTAFAVPPIVREFGIADLMGDVVMVCVNDGSLGDPLVQYVPITLELEVASGVTNNIDFGAGVDVTDAVLVVNENNGMNPTASSTLGGADPRFPVPQFGRLAGRKTLQWAGVNLPVPGAPNDLGNPPADCSISPGCFPPVTTVRFSSMRAKTPRLGFDPMFGIPIAAIIAEVSISASATIPLSNSTLTVAIGIPGLSTSVVPGASPNSFDVVLTEFFATAFKPLGVPTFTPGNTQVESGYFAPGSGVNGGGASQGTRILVRFRGRKARFLSVPNQLTVSGLTLTRVTGADANGAGGVIGPSAGSGPVDVGRGMGFVVYEVVAANPIANEQITLVVTRMGGGPPGNLKPVVNAMFAPISHVTAADSLAPEPRFEPDPTPK